MSSPSALIAALKSLLKSKGIGYRELSVEMGMSESGVKKMLAAKDFPVGRLLKICEWLGVSASDLVRLAEKEDVREIELTAAQIQGLLADDLLLRIYWRLVAERENATTIREAESLNELDLKKKLLKLERLELLKLSANGQIRLRHQGLYRWTPGNPLVDRLEAEWSQLTLRRSLKNRGTDSIHRLSALHLSETSIQDLLQSLNEIANEYARRSQREEITQAAKRLRPFSLLIAGVPHRFIDPDTPADPTPVPLPGFAKTRRRD